ncbi:MAG: hypothetical protein RLZZ461_250 [Planctomycetota bacterium]|jgi:hypothetical protein
MSMMNAPVRRAGGDLDVYTGLLFAAFVVLAAGVVSVAMANMKQVETPSVKGAAVQSESALFGLPGFDIVK